MTDQQTEMPELPVIDPAFFDRQLAKVNETPAAGTDDPITRWVVRLIVGGFVAATAVAALLDYISNYFILSR